MSEQSLESGYSKLESIEENLPASLASKHAVGTAITSRVTELDADGTGIQHFRSPKYSESESYSAVIMTISHPDGVLRRAVEEHGKPFVGEVTDPPKVGYYGQIRYELNGEGDELELIKKITTMPERGDNAESGTPASVSEAEAKQLLERIAALQPDE
jgi:hypothetical protein